MSSKQAFDAKRLTGWWLTPEEIEIIGLDTDDGPEHPLYDDRIKLPLEEAFIANIDEHGIHTPIKIRKNGDKAQCVFGRQRIRAAREVNKRRAERNELPVLVPCTKEQAEERRLMAMGFSENSARVNNDPIQEARDMQRLLAQGYSHDEIAVHFSCSKPKVYQRLTLLELAPAVIKAVRSGQVAASGALALKNLSHEEQVTKLAEIKQSSTNGRRVTAQTVRAATGRHVRPGRKQLAKMIEHGTFGEATAEAFARWWIGEWPASKVKGLTAALKAVGLSTTDE